MQRFGNDFVKRLALVVCLVMSAAAQSDPASGNDPVAPVAVLKSVRLVKEGNGPAIEILSTWPLIPAIQLLDSPTRLVIDLSYTRIGKARKRSSVGKEYIAAIRVDQYQEQPPMTRIVLDLLAPYESTWDAAGNRLMVRLKPARISTTHNTAAPGAPAVLSLSRMPMPAVVPVSSGGGPVALAGSSLAPGSTVSAGNQTAVLSLARGGEVRVCPKTTVSVNTSRNSQELMLGLSTGSLEAHYRLDATADSVITPDFRILFPGPGEFHYAISSESNGDTCVRSLRGNTSSVIVSELLGDRTYQVKPEEQVVFRGGQIDHVDANVPLECGCPPPLPAVLLADVSPSATAALPEKADLNQGDPRQGSITPANDNTALSSGPETAPLPPSQPGDVQVQVDAPIVFSAKNRKAGVPAPPVLPADTAPAARPVPQTLRIETKVPPPPRAAKSTAPSASQKTGFFHKLRGFFGGIFH